MASHSKLLMSPAAVCLGENGASRDVQEEFVWRQFLSHDPSQWWDAYGKQRHKFCGQHVDVQLQLWKASVNNWHQVATTGDEHQELEVATWKQQCEGGQLGEAVHALGCLVERRCHAPIKMFYRVLKRCISQKDLALGTRVHVLSAQSGYEGNAFLATHLIGFYSSHGRLNEAEAVFSKVPRPDSYNWASIILAYARHGEPKKAISLFRQRMAPDWDAAARPDNHVLVALLKACASARDVVTGRLVHAHIVASAGQGKGDPPDMFVHNSLVDMFAKCGSLEDARTVFDGLSHKNVVTWTAMIAGYAQHGMGQEALVLYDDMQREGITQPNSVTFVCLLQACAGLGAAALHHGERLHSQIKARGLQDDVLVGGSLVNMYAKCGWLQEAHSLFDGMRCKNVVTWTALIAGYASQGMGQKALDLHTRMVMMQQECEGHVEPPPATDSVTFLCLLQACASVGAAALPQGRRLHAQIQQDGLLLQQNDVSLQLGGGLVNMYAKCGSVDTARSLFDTLAHKNVVTWTAMITGYVQQGMHPEALGVYSRMQEEGMTCPPDAVTCTCLLQACAATAALRVGKQLHAHMEQQGLVVADALVGSCLVTLYAKCGCMADAQRVFDSLPQAGGGARDRGTWNALIAGYTRQGDSDLVFHLFDRMRGEGVSPDSITFMSVLTVCSHAGLVDKSRHYWRAMTSAEYGISPSLEHYTCMLDVLGRAGHLEEALSMVRSMPLPADGAVWRTVLGACRKWGSVELARQAFELALAVNEQDASAYVLMSNIYEDAEMWEEANEVQARRARCRASKQPGQSWWTDTAGVVHAFAVGDNTSMAEGRHH